MNNDIHTRAVPQLSADMTIFELIDIDPSILSIFSRLKIKLPFGDINVEQICRRDGFSATLFLELCRMHIARNYRPDISKFSDDMLLQVIHYLRASHDYYTNDILPHAAAHLEDILALCDTLSQNTLRGFYIEYVECVREHLDEEEQQLFAVVEERQATTLEKFDNVVVPHTDIDDRTNDIASLIIKCLPDKVPTTLRCAMLHDIYALRDDLRRHSDVEMYILRPMIDKFLTSK